MYDDGGSEAVVVWVGERLAILAVAAGVKMHSRGVCRVRMVIEFRWTKRMADISFGVLVSKQRLMRKFYLMSNTAFSMGRGPRYIVAEPFSRLNSILHSINDA